MTWLDSFLVLFLLFEVLIGLQQGLLWSLVGIFRFLLFFLLILFLAPVLASFLSFLPFAREWLTLGIALILVLAANVLVSLCLRRYAQRWLLPGVWRPLNHALGAISGLLWGFAGAAVLVWCYALWAGEPSAHSLAGKVYQRTQPALDRLSNRAAESFPGLLFYPEGWEIVSARPELRVSPTKLEREMLSLVNKERTKRKLKPVVWDGRLAEVARRHSRDMLNENYFAHQSPKGEDLGDRLRKGRIFYLMAGENLAFAPNLAIAHRGLMNSPGHRANILRPPFRRLGVGIVVIPPKKTYRPRLEGRVLKGNFRGYLVVTQVFAR